MTKSELKAQIDSQITNETTANAITPTKVGTNMKLIVDQNEKTSGAISQSNTTPVALTNDINILNYGGGISYFPNTTEIGKEILVIANSDNCIVRANVGNTAKIFTTFNSFLSSLVLNQNQMYRFVYIGFGTGAGGSVDGFWKAEQM